MSQLSEKCTEILKNAVESGFVSGANVLVLKEGKEILSCQYGYRDLENKLPMERDTIYRLYSMSKPITGAAVMLLMERGMIDLVDPVSKFLPGFANQMVLVDGKEVPVTREANIHDLLSMTSGLPYGDSGTPSANRAKVVFDEIDDRLYSDNPMPLNEVANRLGQCALSFHPGDQWMYGTSADILGAVVEVVAGCPFSEFLKREFFEPLGMNDTGFYVPEEKQNRLAKIYMADEAGTLKEYKTNHLGIRYDMKVEPAFASGGAGLVSTLDDYAKFATMLMNQGTYEGKTILKPKTVSYFTAGSLTPWQMESYWRFWNRLTGFSYGNLLRVLKDPGLAQFVSNEGEYGWDGWLGCVFGNDPVSKTTYLFGIQRPNSGTTWLSRQLRNLISCEIL